MSPTRHHAPVVRHTHPGLAVGVLGISGAVLEEHYNRAGQSQAVTMFDQAAARRRARLRRAAARANRP
jgi:hypothetical protein